MAPGFAPEPGERFPRVQNTDLRPLGAGELLDRAVTLYVRRFVAIATVLAIVIVPLLLFEALVSPGNFRMGDELAQVLQNGGSTPRAKAALDQLLRDSQFSGPFAFVMVTALVMRLLMWNALVAVIAAAYAGAALAPGAAYVLALRRWPAQVVVALAFIAIALIALVPVGILYVVVVAGVVGLWVSGLHVLAVVVGVVLGLAFVVAAAGLSAWLLMAYQLATVAVVTESAGAVVAVSSGLRRAFGRGTRWRTLVAGLIYVVLVYGGSIPVATLGLLMSALTHQPLVAAATSAVAAILIEGLLGAFVVVYATDVRVRREGLDLASLATVPVANAPLPT